jgi:hypothetical protein
MAHEGPRFRRLAKGSAGGAKIASRRDANPRLSPLEAVEDGPFLALLRAHLGEPDHRGDSAFSYCVRDTVLGVDFEAYSGPSGPAYGGSPPDHFIDFARNDNRTKPEVLRSLAAFEAWLAAGDDAPA